MLQEMPTMSLNIKTRRRPRGKLHGLKESIIRIEKEFGRKWLESNDSNPLMNLWMRTDVFATIQLFQLGYSINKIRNLNKKWFDNVIGKIKDGTAGERRGAVLEILIASQFHDPPNRIVLLPRPNNPGYDIKIMHKNGSVIYCQIKNNNWSDQYDIMKYKARSVEEILEANLASDALQVIIKIDTDPDDSDWYSLKNRLPELLKGKNFENSNGVIEGRWDVKIDRMHSQENLFHPDKKTYVMQLITPIPQTEKNGILGDITEACDVLEKKKEPDTDNSINIALICIPLDAPFSLCGGWINEYFDTHPNARISGALLYKPCVVADLERDENFLSHAYHLIIKKGKEDWIKRITTLDISVGRGSISIEGINNYDNFVQLCDGNRRDNYIGYHVYQSGSINYLIKKTGSVRLHNYFGINENVFYIDSDRKEKLAPNDLPRDLDLVLLR
jgi:hypothetical protein